MVGIWASCQQFGVASIGYLIYLANLTDPAQFLKIFFKRPQIPYPTWEQQKFPWQIPKKEEEWNFTMSFLQLSAKQFSK